MSLIGRIRSQLKESAWLLGICIHGFDDLKAGRIQWISNGQYEGKKWFADPFILDYDESEIHLLVEEFDYQVHRGRIAKIIVNRRNWTVEDCKILLDIDTHLSFPMIWKHDDEVFVLPENYHSGAWKMYRYDADKNKLDFMHQMMDEKLTDAIVLQRDNLYYILSSFSPTPNGKELSIWKSDKLTGKYEKCQSIHFAENIGRNAGMVFQADGCFIRPAQESNEEYGHALVFQKLTFDRGKFSLEEFYRHYSTHPIYNIGMHTYNQHTKGMAVVDVKGFRYPFMGRAVKTVGRCLVSAGLKKPYILK